MDWNSLLELQRTAPKPAAFLFNLISRLCLIDDGREAIDKSSFVVFRGAVMLYRGPFHVRARLAMKIFVTKVHKGAHADRMYGTLMRGKEKDVARFALESAQRVWSGESWDYKKMAIGVSLIVGDLYTDLE